MSHKKHTFGITNILKKLERKSLSFFAQKYIIEDNNPKYVALILVMAKRQISSIRTRYDFAQAYCRFRYQSDNFFAEVIASLFTGCRAKFSCEFERRYRIRQDVAVIFDVRS